MRDVEIHEEAAAEAIEAAAWYERERSGLGAEFDVALQAALDLLQEEVVPLVALPGKAGKMGAKRLVLHRFPYDVVVFEGKGRYFVVAFAHEARRPRYWKDRLRT